MHHSMTLAEISDQQREYTHAIGQAAKQVALESICDAIGTVINELSAIRYRLDAGHDLKQIKNWKSIAEGKRAAFAAMQTIADDPPIDAAAIVDDCDEDGLLVNPEYSADAVREYVRATLSQWSGK